MTGEWIKEIEQPEIKKYSPRASKILSASPNSTCMIFSIIGYMGEALVLNHTTLGLLGHPEPGPFLPLLLHHSCGHRYQLGVCCDPGPKGAELNASHPSPRASSRGPVAAPPLWSLWRVDTMAMPCGSARGHCPSVVLATLAWSFLPRTGQAQAAGLGAGPRKKETDQDSTGSTAKVFPRLSPQAPLHLSSWKGYLEHDIFAWHLEKSSQLTSQVVQSLPEIEYRAEEPQRDIGVVLTTAKGHPGSFKEIFLWSYKLTPSFIIFWGLSLWDEAEATPPSTGGHVARAFVADSKARGCRLFATLGWAQGSIWIGWALGDSCLLRASRMHASWFWSRGPQGVV